MRSWYSVLVVLALLGCSGSDESTVPFEVPQDEESTNNDPNIVNILFIGNSLTSFNNRMDFHVQRFYSNGNELPNPVLVDESTLPGATLQ